MLVIATHAADLFLHEFTSIDNAPNGAQWRLSSVFLSSVCHFVVCHWKFPALFLQIENPAKEFAAKSQKAKKKLGGPLAAIGFDTEGLQKNVRQRLLFF